MVGSGFIFDSLKIMYCKCNKVNFRRGVWYIDSQDWIKKKKAIINSTNKNDKCFNMRYL